MKTVAVVLAAGFSKRLGRPKQLLQYRGEPLIRHAARTALGAGCHETIVIGPHRVDLPVKVIDNPHADEGVASSIRLAVEYARGARILFTLCDQPLVHSEHLRALVATKAPIVATGYSGTAGVPAIFGPQFAAELLALKGESGAKAVIAAHLPEVVVIPFESASVDLDTASDVRDFGI